MHVSAWSPGKPTEQDLRFSAFPPPPFQKNGAGNIAPCNVLGEGYGAIVEGDMKSRARGGPASPSANVFYNP